MKKERIAELKREIAELSHKMKWNDNAEEWYEQDVLRYELSMELNKLLYGSAK